MPDPAARRNRTFFHLPIILAAVILTISAAMSYYGLSLPGIGYSREAPASDVKVADVREDPPSAALDRDYLESERDWLLQSQLPNGAIAQTPSQDLVVPYFANLAAKTMVDMAAERAKLYIAWYLDNMNKPDRGGLSGTIYDFVMKDGELRPTYKYDSADSYAATFLSLVSYYFQRTGDRDFVESNLQGIDLAAQAILELQDSDGLVRVMPGSRTKYLMDNSECYKGLLDWAEVLRVLGEDAEAVEYVDAAELVVKGINEVLYDEESKEYAWSLTWLGKRFPKEGQWYPDAVSQTDLIFYGVISPSSEEATAIWSRFNEQFPLWDQGLSGDRFPWAKIALTATMMGDTSRAERFVTWARDEFATNGRPYPWYVMESASTLETARAILRQSP